MAKHIKTYTVIIEFKKISDAVECVGILKDKNITSHVEGDDGKYHVIVAVLKSKRASDALIEELQPKLNYTLEVKKGK